ncbi:Peroxisomal membrane protein PAS20 [Geranomyces variabilis]|nr:Peroxisomal membrane protein PAS20 [Geranomyces variabilis]
MPSPPKPWERAGAGASQPAGTTTGPATGASTTTTTSAAAQQATPPARPESAAPAMVTNQALNRQGYGTGYNSPGMMGGAGYGAGGYGSTYGNSYSSPYSRYGGTTGYGATGYGGYGSSYGSSYGGGYGGYGSRFGGGAYGGGGYGAGRFGQGPYGGGPGDMPLSAQMEQSTQATFNTLDSIVQAFGGFAQMLESTFMATHSSFMAMVGVAEQFGSLRQYLGQLFSLVSLYRLARRVACRLTGQPVPVDTAGLNAEGLKAFEENKKRSKKPLWVFLFFTVGIPWLISKLYQRLQRQRLEAATAAGGLAPGAAAAGLVGPDGLPLQPSQIRDLEFCRALFDFKAETPNELSFAKGTIIAILSKLDPATGQPGPWWRGRLQSGEMGMFPASYVELIVKAPQGPGLVPVSSLSSATPASARGASPVPATSSQQQPAISAAAQKQPVTATPQQQSAPAVAFDPQSFNGYGANAPQPNPMMMRHPPMPLPFDDEDFGPSFLNG